MMKKLRIIISSWGFWLQVVVWLALFTLPVVCLRADDLFHLSHCLLYSVFTLALAFIFYLNYFYLAPQLTKGRKRLYWTVNTFTILTTTTALHVCINSMHDEVLLMGLNFSYTRIASFLYLRKLFTFMVSASVGTAIVLSRQWSITEKERLMAEKEKKEAELASLRYQFNPHFLLNTLNNIYALTGFDQRKAQEAIMELSRMMRYILYEQKSFVSIQEEIRFIKDYVNLMRIRISEGVSITETYAVNTQSIVQVAPMIFISLVENAFKHGVSYAEKCFISIRIEADAKHIVCHVKNSYHPKDTNDQSGHSIGRRQVARLLELNYPGKYIWEHGLKSGPHEYSSKIIIYDTKLCNH